jgi:hypothetical protein
MWLQLTALLDLIGTHWALTLVAVGGTSLGAIWRKLKSARLQRERDREIAAATVTMSSHAQLELPEPLETRGYDGRAGERGDESTPMEREVTESPESDGTALSRSTLSRTSPAERSFNFRFEGAGHVDGALLRNTPIRMVFSDRLAAAAHTAFTGRKFADVLSKENASLTLVLSTPTGVELTGPQVAVAKFAAGSLVQEVAFDLEVKDNSAAVVDLHVDFFAGRTLLYGLPISIAVRSSEVTQPDRGDGAVPLRPVMVDLDAADAEGGGPGILLSLSVGIDGLSMTLIQSASGGAADTLLTGRHPEMTAAALQALLDQIRNELGSDFFNPPVWKLSDPGQKDWRTDPDLLGCCERVASAGSILYQAICRSEQCRSILEYINTKPAGTRLTVVTTDASLPLEIVYPIQFSKFSPASERKAHPVAPEHFWGVRFALETLQSGPGDYGAMRRRHWLAPPEVSFNLNSAITTDHSPGPMAMHESFAMKLKDTGVQCSLQDDCDSMRETLLASASTAGVIYVYCHGAGAIPGVGATELLQLDYNCFVRPNDIVPGKKFANAPVVILNACLAGSTSPLLFTGFLKAFRAQGALGIVATTFYVPILFGAAFGTTLVESCLRDDAPLSEQLRALRQAKAEMGNLAPLFYSVQCQLDL